MKKIKKLYKKNKVLFILCCIAILCVLIIIIGLFTSFYKGANTNKYGDRLDGIKDVKISDKTKSSVKSLYKDDEKVKSAKVDIKGKIIYITVDVKDGTKVADAQGMVVKGLEEFSDKELEYYDVQFIITCNEQKENKVYPTMGYKNNTSKNVVWVNRNA